MRITTALAIVPLVGWLGQTPVSAQDGGLPARSSHLSVGVGGAQQRNESGWSVDVTSPYLVDGRVAARLSLSRTELEGVRLNNLKFTEMPYTTLKGGLVAVAGSADGLLRAYAQFGVAIIRPNTDFSDDDVLGGHLGFGIEFFWGRGDGARFSSYMELGGVFADPVAEKLPGQPLYATGTDIGVGVRFYF